MKIRIGFVSNSSSSSYILAVKGDLESVVKRFLKKNKATYKRFKKEYEGDKEALEKYFTVSAIAERIKSKVLPFSDELLAESLDATAKDYEEFASKEICKQETEKIKTTAETKKNQSFQLYYLALNTMERLEGNMDRMFTDPEYFGCEHEAENFWMRWLTARY